MEENKKYNPKILTTMARHTYEKVVFEYPVKEIHGKVCKHTDVYFGKNGLSGKLYTSRICNPSTKVTAAMLQQRLVFKQASDYAKAVMLDATRRAAAEVRFAGQSKYKSLRAFLMVESMSGNEVNA